MRRRLAALLLALGCAGSASAHPVGPHTGFISTVSGIEPPLPGLLVQVIRGHEQVSVRNLTQKTVVIYDERGRPSVRLAPGESGAWADPRVAPSGPPPEREGLVRKWRIAGEADGERFAIVGFLGYRPPPAEADEGGLPAWAVVLAGTGGAVVLAAALALPLLRRKGEDERGDTATER